MKKFKLKDINISIYRKILGITLHDWIDIDLMEIDLYQQIHSGIKLDSSNQTLIICQVDMSIRDNLEKFFYE